MYQSEVDGDRYDAELEVLKERYLQLQEDLGEATSRVESYLEDNKVEFFGVTDEERGLKGPNPLQAELLRAWENQKYKVFVYSGANRIGKTSILVIVAIATVFGYWPWEKTRRFVFPHKKPRRIRIVGQDWEKHIKTVLLPALEEWWPKNRPVEKKKNNVGADAFWRDMKTRSTIEIMSNNQESALHEGWNGDLICYDEPPTRLVRVANARGLIDRCGRELFAMTLLKEAWIDREVIKAVDKDGKPDKTIYSISGDIFVNLGFGITREGIEQFDKTLTDEERAARINGLPSYMSGLVYADFKRNIHLKPRFQVPLDWLVDIAIDVHPRERQAVLFCATSPRQDRYLVNEIWENGDGTWLGEQIVRCIELNRYRVGTIIIDPLAKGDKNNENTVFDKVQAVLWRYGYRLDTASKDKDSGLLMVKQHLKGPNNEPSLFIFDDLVRTCFEIEGYMWDKDTQKAQDKDDHMMENLYRICLLNTQWYAIEDEKGDTISETHTGRNPVTGY